MNTPFSITLTCTEEQGKECVVKIKPLRLFSVALYPDTNNIFVDNDDAIICVDMCAYMCR